MFSEQAQCCVVVVPMYFIAYCYAPAPDSALIFIISCKDIQSPLPACLRLLYSNLSAT